MAFTNANEHIDETESASASLSLAGGVFTTGLEHVDETETSTSSLSLASGVFTNANEHIDESENSTPYINVQRFQTLAMGNPVDIYSQLIMPGDTAIVIEVGTLVIPPIIYDVVPENLRRFTQLMQSLLPQGQSMPVGVELTEHEEWPQIATPINYATKPVAQQKTTPQPILSESNLDQKIFTFFALLPLGIFNLSAVVINETFITETFAEIIEASNEIEEL